MASPDLARLKRSYERNVAHSRFWAGVGTALLGALLLFVANTLWKVGTEPEVLTPPARTMFGIGIFILGDSSVMSFLVSWIFRNLYRSDDQALASIEQDEQESPQ